MRFRRSLLALAAGMLAAACASGPPRKETSDSLERYLMYAGAPVRSFHAYRIDGWTPLTRDKLLLWTGIDDAYLLTVRPACPDLLFATAIRVTSTGSTISQADSVRVGRDRCPISQIVPIDLARLQADRTGHRAE